MTPSVDGNLVTFRIGIPEGDRVRNDTRANVEESHLHTDLAQIREKVWSIGRWTIVKGNTPCKFIWTSGDIGISYAATACPPAARCVCDCLGISGTSTSDCGCNVRNVNPGSSDVLDPLEDFRRVRGRKLVERWVVGRQNGRHCG